jgi:succinylglutamate desuccinylase
VEYFDVAEFAENLISKTAKTFLAAAILEFRDVRLHDQRNDERTQETCSRHRARLDMSFDEMTENFEKMPDNP